MRANHLYTVEGIILKRKNVGEADRILTVFTKEEGKIRIIAKGVRRIKSRRAGHIEVFSHAILTLHKGNLLDSVVEASHVGRHVSADSHSIDKLGYCYFLCELIDKLLADHQEHEEAFVLFAHAVSAMRKESTHQGWQRIAYIFSLELLQMLGFLPHTKKLSGSELFAFIENVAERKFRTVALMKKLAIR